MTKSPKSPAQTPYVAFLRGVNVGGNKLMRMEDLKQAFAALRFANVTTVLASGNVLFAGETTSEPALATRIEEKLRQAFQSETGVIVRSIESLKKLAASEPFSGVRVTPQTRLYVTFLPQSPGRFKTPYTAPDKSFTILRVSPAEVCTVLTLSPKSGTVDLMGFLEKQFGKKITTRNWNTIVRILKSAG